MFSKKEISGILVITIIVGFAVNFLRNIEILHFTMISVFSIILINSIAKKISAFYLDSEVEIKIWEIQRIGFKPNRYFKKPIPAGAFMPLIFSAITHGYFAWMASLVFDVKAKIYRAAKRHGLYSFSEMTESHIGFIAATGIIANLVFSIIGYLIGLDRFAELNIYYAFFNMIPISDLDGNKIFFGNLILWSFLAALVLVGMGYIFFVV